MKISLLLVILLIQVQTFGQCDCTKELDQQVIFHDIKVCSKLIYPTTKKDKDGRDIYIIERFQLYNTSNCQLLLDMDKGVQTEFNFYVGDSTILIHENILMPCLVISDPTKPWADQTGRCALDIVDYSLNQKNPSEVRKSIPVHDFEVDDDSLSVIKERVLLEVRKFNFMEKGHIDSLLALDVTGNCNNDLVYYGILIGIMNDDAELINLFENFDSMIPEVKIQSHLMIMENMKYVKEKFKKGG